MEVGDWKPELDVRGWEFEMERPKLEEFPGFMTNEERKAALEAIIYAADEPATIEQLATALGAEKLAVQSSLDELVASYASEERGIEVRGGRRRLQDVHEAAASRCGAALHQEPAAARCD